MKAPPIRLLPHHVAEQIAAGEVIDRPAAAVKELIENALDAGGRRIRVEVRGGGLELLRVADDGHGIASEQLTLAFARHATSKIAQIEDLQRLETLGFRGEALPSIAAISEVTLVSATAADRPGAAITIRYGEVMQQGTRASAPGTAVTVRGLFGNVPARRTFLKIQRAESARIGEVVRRYALGRPDVAFTLLFDGRHAFTSLGDGRALGVLAALYGAGVAETLAPVTAALPDGGALSGYAGTGGPWHAGRHHVTLFINGRWVRAGAVAQAVEAAYRPFAPAGRHPPVLLWFTLPPSRLDPNVHPAKLEVRVAGQETLAEGVKAAVSAAFGRMPAAAAASAALQYRLPFARRRVAEQPAAYLAEGGGGVVAPSAAYRFLATARDGVIIAEGNGGLLLVDQHRAHERILFEELRAGAGVKPQALLTPALLRPSRAQTSRIQQRTPDLTAMGFVLEPFGGGALVARTVPAALPGMDSDALSELLEAALSDAADWQERLLATAACRAAIKKGQPIDADTARSLLERLSATESPAVCPHGSPVSVRIDGRLLARLFRW